MTTLSDFAKDDRVRVKAGEYAGGTGTVTIVRWSKGYVAVLIDGSDSARPLHVDQLEKVSA